MVFLRRRVPNVSNEPRTASAAAHTTALQRHRRIDQPVGSLPELSRVTGIEQQAHLLHGHLQPLRVPHHDRLLDQVGDVVVEVVARSVGHSGAFGPTAASIPSS